MRLNEENNVNVSNLIDLFSKMEDERKNVLDYFKKNLLPKYLKFCKKNKEYLYNYPAVGNYCYFDEKNIEVYGHTLYNPDYSVTFSFSLEDILNEEKFYNKLNTILDHEKTMLKEAEEERYISEKELYLELKRKYDK